MLKINSKTIAGLLVAFVLTFAGVAHADWMATTATKITKSSSKADVMWLQQTLNALDNAGLVVDGLYGKKTTAAIKVFQTGHPSSGKADGIVGKLTIAALNAAGASGGSGSGSGSGSGGSQSGPVSAALSTDNPATGTIVAGQATADLMHIKFTGNGTVNSVTLTRGGVSDQNTLTNVYLYDGVTRLTDGYSFNTNGTITMNNLGLAVNGSRTVAVKADVYSSTTSYDIYVTLSSFSVGTTVNTVAVKGNDMFIAGSGSLATASVSGSNTVSAASVNAGTSSYTVWRAPIQVNTRSLWLKAANFRITGSAPSDALQNVGLYVDGVKVGNNAMMTTTNGSNYLTFDMTANPLSLTTGSHTVEVRGDVIKGSSYNLTVSLQMASDLMVTDPQIGVNVAFSGTIPNTAGQISIGTGSYTGVVDPTFSTMTNTTAGASNVAIARFKLHGYGEDIKVTSLPITPVLSGTTPAASGLQNVTLYFNGAQVGSQQGWTSGALTFSLGSQMIVPAGADSTLEVRADLRTTGGTNYTAGSVSANMGAATAEGWSSHASITGPTATGNILTMQSATLAIGKNAGYINQNAAPNTAGVKIGSYILQNQSTSESVRVTTLKVNTAYGAFTATSPQGSADLAGLRTSETSGNAGTPQQPATAAASSNADNTFSSDFTIAPGATKTIDVFADSSSAAAASATVQTSLTVTSIGVTSNVSTTSSAVPGQTITFQTGTVATPTVVTSSSTIAQLVAAANGGSTDGSKMTFNFTSSNAPSTVSELTFTVSGSTTATSIKVNGISAPFVSGTAYMTGLSIAVPNGGSGVNVDAYVSYPEVGTSGLTSATTSAITLTTVKYTSGNSTSTLTGLTVPSSAITMTLVGSMPSYSLAGSTDTLANGSVKLLEVTVTANAKGDIRVGQLPITVTSTGVVTIVSAADNIVVKDTSGATIATKNATFGVTTGSSATGVICFDTTTAACGSGQTNAGGYLIPAGTSKTFRIYVTAATVSGAVNTTSLSTKLGASSSATYYDVAGGVTGNTPQAETLLYNYPTDSYSIHN